MSIDENKKSDEFMEITKDVFISVNEKVGETLNETQPLTQTDNSIEKVSNECSCGIQWDVHILNHEDNGQTLSQDWTVHQNANISRCKSLKRVSEINNLVDMPIHDNFQNEYEFFEEF